MTLEQAKEIIKNAKPIEPIKLNQTSIVNFKDKREKTLEEKQKDLRSLKEFFDKRRKINNIINKVRYGSTR